MSGELLKDVTFNKVCNMLKKQTPLWDEVKMLVKALATFAPKLVAPELTAGITLGIAADAGQLAFEGIDVVGRAYGVAKRLVAQEKDTSYITRAENAQAANVLIIFTAYFDTIRQIIPDADKNIFLGEMQPVLVEKSIQNQQIFEQQTEVLFPITEDKSFSLPNVLDGASPYEVVLKGYYSLITSQLRCYLYDLAYYEQMPEYKKEELNTALNGASEKAVRNYWAQYFILASDSPEFFVLATHQKHVEIKKDIDCGFNDISTKLENIHRFIDYGRACEAFDSLDRQYRARIRKPIIGSEKLIRNELEMALPTIDEIYIPQAYKWLQYKEYISLEATDTWKDGGSIGEDIANVLRHPELGTKPILILGDPGAGKTTLCHMIAGKLLRHEYHTIILYLRDLNADSSVAEQLSQQLKSCYCDWSTIVRSKPTKPILLLFDGYDELLQASGNTYSNFIQKIVEFQEDLWDSQELIVRSIITSRIALIDKANIPVHTTVFRLQPMDEERINTWCSIWNKKNEAYYRAKALNPFSIEADGNVAILAKEPLLLAMLALYDANNNALQNNKNLKATELYYCLIRDFVEREKSKDKKFRGLEDAARNDEISKEIERLAIAALGMYNREELYITSDQLEKDFQLLLDDDKQAELTNSELLFGRFFFVQRMQACKENEKKNAYTFLHNTFCEFLAAYYISSRLLVSLSSLKPRGNYEAQTTSQTCQDTLLHSCLAHAPLFKRPKICDMIEEWFPLYVQRNKRPATDFDELVLQLVECETLRVLRGEKWCDLSQITGHFEHDDSKPVMRSLTNYSAVYSINLMVIAALLVKGMPLSRIEDRELDAWQKLLRFWRISFDESSMSSFARQYRVDTRNGQSIFVARRYSSVWPFDIGIKEAGLYDFHTYNSLYEKPERDILGAMLGDCPKFEGAITSWLKTKGLQNRLVLSYVATNNPFLPLGGDPTAYFSYVNECIQNENYESIFILFLLLDHFLSVGAGVEYVKEIIKKNLLVIDLSLFDNYPSIFRALVNTLCRLIPNLAEDDNEWLFDTIHKLLKSQCAISAEKLMGCLSLMEVCIKTEFIVMKYGNKLLEIFRLVADLLRHNTFPRDLELKFFNIFFVAYERNPSILACRIYAHICSEIKRVYLVDKNESNRQRAIDDLLLLCKSMIYLQSAEKLAQSEPTSFAAERLDLIIYYCVRMEEVLVSLLRYMSSNDVDIVTAMFHHPGIILVLCNDAIEYPQQVADYLGKEFGVLIRTHFSDITLNNYKALVAFVDKYHSGVLRDALAEIIL